jgi:hypothetical protein
MSARTNLLLATTVAVASIATAGVAAAAVGIESSGDGEQTTTATIKATNPVYCEIGAKSDGEIEFRSGSDDDYEEVVTVTHGCNTSYDLRITDGEPFKPVSSEQDNGQDSVEGYEKIQWNFTGGSDGIQDIQDKEFGDGFTPTTILSRQTSSAVRGDNITDTVSLDLKTGNDVAVRAVESGDYEATVTFAVTPN